MIDGIKCPDDSNAIINGLRNTYIVEKTKALLNMKDVPYSLYELKLLDIYLSRINARNPERDTVIFSKEEYENIVGIKQVKPKQLNNNVKALMSRAITIPEKDKDGNVTCWSNYILFDESKCYKEDGTWWVKLTCSVKAKELFFNITSAQYIHYQLKNVTSLTSKYSMLLYLYLIDNVYKHNSWMISTDALKYDVLKVDKSSTTYKNEFKDFNKSILSSAVCEISEKTNLNVSYQTEYANSKSVKYVMFTVLEKKSLGEELRLQEQDMMKSKFSNVIDDKAKYDFSDYSNESIAFMAEACNYRFDEVETKVLYNYLIEIVPESNIDNYSDGLAAARYIYLRAKYYKFLSSIKDKNTIQNEFLYFKKIISSDYEKHYIFQNK